MQNRILQKRLIIFVILLAIIFGIRFTGVGNYLTMEHLKANRDYLQLLVQENYLRSVLIYIAFYIGIAALSLPLAALLTVAGGFLFGVFFGAVYANIGATIGATISFLLVRHLLGSMLQQKYAKQLVRFNEEVNQYGANYLLTMHLIALVPFFVVNILAGLTNISLWTFIWTTSAGIFPGAFVYTFAGQQLGTINTMRDILSLKILLAFGLLGLLALVPMILQRLRNNSAKN